MFHRAGSGFSDIPLGTWKLTVSCAALRGLYSKSQCSFSRLGRAASSLRCVSVLQGAAVPNCVWGSSAELRAPPLWSSPLEPFTGPVAAVAGQSPFSFLQLERCQDFYCSFSCVSHIALWLMPTLRAKPVKAGKAPTPWDAPRFECALQSACF